MYSQIIAILLADVRIKVSRGDDRITRSTGQANSLSVSFNISDTLLDFHLTRNDEIRTNVPIYTADDKGNIKTQRISELEVRPLSRTIIDTSKSDLPLPRPFPSQVQELPLPLPTPSA